MGCLREGELGGGQGWAFPTFEVRLACFGSSPALFLYLWPWKEQGCGPDPLLAWRGWRSRSVSSRPFCSTCSDKPGRGCLTAPYIVPELATSDLLWSNGLWSAGWRDWRSCFQWASCYNSWCVTILPYS